MELFRKIENLFLLLGEEYKVVANGIESNNFIIRKAYNMKIDIGIRINQHRKKSIFHMKFDGDEKTYIYGSGVMYTIANPRCVEFLKNIILQSST